MPDLVAPTAGLRTAWLEAHAEWGPGAHEDSYALRLTNEVDSADGIVAWVARLAEESDPATPVAACRCHPMPNVTCSTIRDQRWHRAARLAWSVAPPVDPASRPTAA